MSDYSFIFVGSYLGVCACLEVPSYWNRLAVLFVCLSVIGGDKYLGFSDINYRIFRSPTCEYLLVDIGLSES